MKRGLDSIEPALHCFGVGIKGMMDLSDRRNKLYLTDYPLAYVVELLKLTLLVCNALR